ncbi:MAG: c-type cytochrome [Polyangiaceae bacterium]|nr:c-type cytochrome [Polyangiaceae bacterium]
MRTRNVVVLVFAALTATACSKSESSGAGGKADMAQAKQIFESRCVTCHGKSGHGDGVLAANLDPKPRNYTDKAWQKSVTDDQLKKTIVEGGAAVGKSAGMTPNPDLKDKPEVLEGLVQIIRGFGK